MERHTRIIIIVSLTVLLALVAFQNVIISLRRADRDTDIPSSTTLQNMVGNTTLQKAIEAMRSKGYASMALLLEIQPLVMDLEERKSKFLIAAPSDKAVARVKGELSQVLLRHIMNINPRKKEVGFVRTFSSGFVITMAFIEELGAGLQPYALELLCKDDTYLLTVYGLLGEEIFPPLTEEDAINKS